MSPIGSILLLLANIPPIISSNDTLEVRQNESTNFEMTIQSNNLANISIEFVRFIRIFNQSDNSTANETTESSVFSTDVPKITSEISTGNSTKVNVTWTPHEENITGFSIFATDNNLGSTLVTPLINYNKCRHPNAVAIFQTIAKRNTSENENVSIENNNYTTSSNDSGALESGISRCISY